MTIIFSDTILEVKIVQNSLRLKIESRLVLHGVSQSISLMKNVG